MVIVIAIFIRSLQWLGRKGKKLFTLKGCINLKLLICIAFKSLRYFNVNFPDGALIVWMSLEERNKEIVIMNNSIIKTLKGLPWMSKFPPTRYSFHFLPQYNTVLYGNTLAYNTFSTCL